MSRIKKRTKNFSPMEENLIIQLVNMHKDIIETNRSDMIGRTEKELAWKSIEEKYNNSFGVNPKNSFEIRTKYKNLKRNFKKTITDEKSFRTDSIVDNDNQNLTILNELLGPTNCIDAEYSNDVSETVDCDLRNDSENEHTQDVNEIVVNPEEQQDHTYDWNEYRSTLSRKRKASTLHGRVRNKSPRESNSKWILAKAEMKQIEQSLRHNEEIHQLKIKHMEELQTITIQNTNELHQLKMRLMVKEFDRNAPSEV